MRYLWVAVGLVAWAALVVVWAEGPYDCTVPDHNHRVHCKG